MDLDDIEYYHIVIVRDERLDPGYYERECWSQRLFGKPNDTLSVNEGSYSHLDIKKIEHGYLIEREVDLVIKGGLEEELPDYPELNAASFLFPEGDLSSPAGAKVPRG